MGQTLSANRASDQRQSPTGHGNQADGESPDANCEVATVLLSKRWKKREEPFRGFDSPPGKF